MSWESRSSNKLGLLIEKLKKPQRWIAYVWWRKGRSRNQRKHEDTEYKFSSYFFSKFSCANLSSCVSFFSPCLIQETGAFPASFLKIIIFFQHKMRSSCYWQVHHRYTFLKCLKIAIILMCVLCFWKWIPWKNKTSRTRNVVILFE